MCVFFNCYCWNIVLKLWERLFFFAVVDRKQLDGWRMWQCQWICVEASSLNHHWVFCLCVFIVYFLDSLKDGPRATYIFLYVCGWRIMYVHANLPAVCQLMRIIFNKCTMERLRLEGFWQSFIFLFIKGANCWVELTFMTVVTANSVMNSTLGRLGTSLWVSDTCVWAWRSINIYGYVSLSLHPAD